MAPGGGCLHMENRNRKTKEEKGRGKGKRKRKKEKGIFGYPVFWGFRLGLEKREREVEGESRMMDDWMFMNQRGSDMI